MVPTLIGLLLPLHLHAELNAGLNVIAIEIHQFDAASSDMSFNLKLDGDGTSNFTEMKARTSPLVRTPLFAITAATRNASGQMTLSWPTIPGVLYQIRRSDTLSPWTTLPGTITGNGSMKFFTDTEPLSPGMAKVFYQVIIP